MPVYVNAKDMYINLIIIISFVLCAAECGEFICNMHTQVFDQCLLNLLKQVRVRACDSMRLLPF